MDYCNNHVCEEGGCCLHVNSPCLNHELLYMKRTECYADSTSKTSLSSNLDLHLDLGIFEDGSSAFEELCAAFAKIMHARTLEEPLSRECFIPEKCEIISIIDELECQEVKSNELEIVCSNAKKRLEKSATFPSSGDKESTNAHVSTSLSSVPSNESQNGHVLTESYLVNPEKGACVRSVSLPSALKLVSAMRGGRDREGLTPKVKLCVKWAPDVYDPPTTSMSHTVKGHHQRPKVKRKDKHKHKHKGSRSSRGSGSERQRSSRNYYTTSDSLV